MMSEAKKKSMRGAPGRARMQTSAGATVKPLRGLYEVRDRCNEFLRDRGLMPKEGTVYGDYQYGKGEVKDPKRAELARRRREEARMEAMVAGMESEEF